jgi:PadR family transcriptional regulator, regulatory protein PadR
MRVRLGGEALRGHLDLLVLSVLRDTEAHGYRVIELLRESSGGAFDLPEGTIYPALHRLERAGYLRSRWTAGDGPRRRVYALTPAGRRERRRQGQSWQAFTRAVGGVIGAS